MPNQKHNIAGAKGETVNETGTDRIRKATERDRGGNAPTERVQVCGPDCRGEITANPNDGPDYARYYRKPKPLERVLDPLICPGCIRFKFSPFHLFYRLIGICDGRNCC